MTDLLFLEPSQQVYVIERDKNNVKIGVSTQFARRSRAIETQGGFKAKRCFVGEKLSNGYAIESAVHYRFRSQRLIGEWFAVSFEDAVKAVQEVEKEIGETETAAYTSPTFWKLPTAMEELKADDPDLYDWFVKNEYCLEYGHHLSPELTGMVVLGDFGESGLIDFKLFVAIIKSELRAQKRKIT